MLDLLGQTFFQHALAAGALVGGLCSFLGVYILLRRIVFLGIAVAQIASAAVALALLLDWHPLTTALAAGIAAALGFSQVRPGGRLPAEAVLGVSYVLAAALGTVFVAWNPVGEARVLRVLFGNILSVPAPELLVLALVTALVLAVHLQFRKEFVLVSFDAETAAALGVRARLWDLLLFLTLGAAIAFAIRSVGVLVTFALLVGPAVGARLLVGALGALFAAALALGVLAVPLGLGVAFALDLPAGATVALTVVGLSALAPAARRLVRRLRPAAGVAAGLLLLLAVGAADAQAPAPERELEALRAALTELQRVVAEQQGLIDELRAARPGAAPPAPPAPPGVAPPAPAPQVTPAAPPPAGPAAVALPTVAPAGPPPGRAEAAGPRALPPWLAYLPELRVEGNVIGNYTFNQRRRRALERVLGEDDEFFVRRDRFNVREIEIGLRSAIDPFARFEAILSAEQVFGGEVEVGLEEAFLTSGTLPAKLDLKAGKFRTGFGEFNESDPEEIPAVDPPNVITNVFGREGDGWIDTGLALTRLFGITDALTLTLWGAVFNGDNDEAFHGGGAGVARRPAWFVRAESFLELSESTGLEVGVGIARGTTLDEAGRARLRSRILNAHLELDYRHPVLALYRGVNVLTEAFYTLREHEEEDERETIHRWGLYSIAEAQIARQWSIAGRFDYSQLPEPGDERRLRWETAGSAILSFRPSRFLTLRSQYKHTERNFAPDSDELFLQALFILGYERPGLF